MMNLYCIPGLGADEKLFLKFKPAGYQLQFIKWTEPKVGDTLGSYSESLLSQIDQRQPFALLGVSLGGMLAVELASRCSPAKVFVISSIKSSKELPLLISFLKHFKFLISYRLLTSSKPLIELLFGRLCQADRQLIFDMIDQSDEAFTVWAAKAILTWKSEDHLIPFDKVVHIVGDRDMIFRYTSLKNLIVVEGGTHLMILNRADEIAQLVENRR